MVYFYKQFFCLWKVHIVSVSSGATHGCGSHVRCWRWYRLGWHDSLWSDIQHRCLYIHSSEHSPQSQTSPSAVCACKEKSKDAHLFLLILPYPPKSVLSQFSKYTKTGDSQGSSGPKRGNHTHCKEHIHRHSWQIQDYTDIPLSRWSAHTLWMLLSLHMMLDMQSCRLCIYCWHHIAKLRHK